MKVHVKQCDIIGAGRGMHECPIARALNREYGDGWMVGSSMASNADGEAYRLDCLGTYFVTAWAVGKFARPAVFDVERVR